MSISSVSSTSFSYPQQDSTRATARDLVNAIQSGDLKTAQQDYATLTQGAANPSSTSPLSQDFAAIGKALESGDISGAQDALATLQADAQKTGKGHHHHHHHHAHAAGSQDGQTVPGVADTSSASNSSGATTTFSTSA